MIPKYKLRDGNEIPAIGLGTWQLKGDHCINAVKLALEIGYRHIDTAEIYGNEKEIGIAINNFPRDEIFITSKVSGNHLKFNNVIKSCEFSLRNLNTNYLDLYLIHWPNPFVSLRETFKAMKKLHDDGKIISFGVSNFDLNLLKKALEIEEIPICVNQVEFHPFFYQKDLLEFCKKHNIILVAYSPLARGKINENKIIKEIARKYEKTPAQISLRWIIQKGAIPIPKASTKEHLKENIDVFNWSISKEDEMKIDNIKKFNLNPISFAFKILNFLVK
jgi:diketogulonate reductase-like aldo/keto reductase